MRKLLVGLSFILNINTLLTAGPIVTVSFENGNKMTITTPQSQRITVSDIRDKLEKSSLVPIGYSVELFAESGVPVPESQVFKRHCDIELWANLVRLSANSPVSPGKKSKR